MKMINELKVGDIITVHGIKDCKKIGENLRARGLHADVQHNSNDNTYTFIIRSIEEPKEGNDDKNPDIDELIKTCKDSLGDDDSIVYGFGVGRMVPLPFDNKKVKKGIEEGLKYIKSLDGFLGVHPIDVYKNILMFDTLNNAKGGRNLLKAKDVSVGQIVPLILKTEYLKEAANDRKQSE